MALKKNMGTADRIVRLLIAVLIAVLSFTGKLPGIAAIIFGIVAVAFVVTSIVGFCPAYVPFTLSTGKKKEEGKR